MSAVPSRPARARLVVLHSYSVASMRELVSSGASPRQQLWGTDHLEAAGWEIDLVPRGTNRLLRAMSRAMRMQLGDLELEARALWRVRGAAGVVALEPSTARGIGLLRRLRLVRKPLIQVAHPCPPVTLLARVALTGADHVITLSRALTEDLVARAGRDPDRTTTIWWGPAGDYAPYERSTAGGGIVSSGKTNRDLESLLAAAEGLDVPVTVCLPSDSPHLRANAPPNVSFLVADDHPALIATLAQADVVAIPLARVDGTFGVSELNDCLALGKPVVMTENSYIDLPLAAEGAAVMFALRDVAALRLHLVTLMDDAAARSTMSMAGRRLASANDYDAFGRHLVAVVDALAA